MDQTLASARSQALVYDGRIGELYSIFLLNLLFTILTFGIFRFWAITRYRRYFWARMSFQGERFEYTGTGGELFVGYLLAGLVLVGGAVVTMLLAYVLALVWGPLAALPILLFYVGIFVLAAGAVFSAQRYRLTRTLWCGIRGGMTGSMVRYGLRSVLYALLAGVTLFQMAPWRQVRLAERRINASSFGNVPFSFRGSARRVYLPYLLTFVGNVVLLAVIGSAVLAAVRTLLPNGMASNPDSAQVKQALGLLVYVGVLAVFAFGILSALVSCWYTALFERHVVGNTALGAMRCTSSMTGAGLLGLVVGNLFIMLFTLGLGYPVVLHRNARFLSRTLWVGGTLDPAALQQSALIAPRYGEGMFQQLDSSGWM